MPKRITKISHYQDSGDSYPHGELSGDPAMVDEVLPYGSQDAMPIGVAIKLALGFKGNQTQLRAARYSVWSKLKVGHLLDRIIPLQRKPKKPVCPHCLGKGWIGSNPCLAEGCRE